MDLKRNLARVNELSRSKLLTEKEKSKIKDFLLSSAHPLSSQLSSALSITHNDQEAAYEVQHLLSPAKPKSPNNNPATSLLPSRTYSPPPLNQTILFHCREMEAIALASVQRSFGHLKLGKISWNRFDEAEGWPHIFIHEVGHLECNDVMFLASFHSPSVVFEQLSAIYALARYGCRSLRVIVPFFPTGTMERVDVLGDVATASTLARMITMTPLTRGGPTQFVFLDIHALQEQFYFGDNVMVFLKSCVRLLLEAVQPLGEVVICFPDDGAFKRFHNKFAGFKTVICHKLRLEKDARKVEVRDGKEFLPNSHVIIVDDLVKSGGTLLECALALKLEGASKVSCYCTHAVFPNRSFERFLHVKNPSVKMEHFWITDSVPTIAEEVRNQAPFEVLSIAPLIAFLRQNFWDQERQNPNWYD